MVDGNCLCEGERAAEELTPTVSTPGERLGYCNVSLAERKRKPHGREFRFRGVQVAGAGSSAIRGFSAAAFYGEKIGF